MVIEGLGYNGTPRLPQSKDVFSLASQWINICLDSHHKSQCGPRNEGPYLPKRLIDVEARSADMLGLVISADSVQPKSTYIALSYCWGLSMPTGVKTTRSNLEMHLQGISMSSLPLTIQDAIVATRRLGIRYLWIDALCILQDSREDWEFESAAMSDIYSHAFCTIAAAATNHCDGGMLFRADRRRFAVVTLADKVFVKASTIPHQDLKDSNPLSTRAWALQERELSPRVLWFTAHELLFECHRMWASEEYPDCDTHSSDSTGALDRIFDCRSLDTDESLYHYTSLLSLGGIYLIWRRIVERYSSRLLTHPTDRLPAISGLAHEIQTVYRSKYAAGIWINDLPRALLWRRAAENAPDRAGGIAELPAISELPGNDLVRIELSAHNSIRTELSGDAIEIVEPLRTGIARADLSETEKARVEPHRDLEKSMTGLIETTTLDLPPSYTEGRVFEKFGTLELVSNLTKGETAIADSSQIEHLPFVHLDNKSIFLGPSWSWAAVEGPINYRSASLEFMKNYDPNDAEIMAVHTSNLGANPMGEVSSAYIRMSACIMPLREWLDNIASSSWSEDMIRFDYDSITTKTSDIFILGVLRRRDHQYTGSFVYDGLLVMEMNSIFGPGYEYRRVGLIRNVYASWMSKAEKKEIVLV